MHEDQRRRMSSRERTAADQRLPRAARRNHDAIVARLPRVERLRLIVAQLPTHAPRCRAGAGAAVGEVVQVLSPLVVARAQYPAAHVERRRGPLVRPRAPAVLHPCFVRRILIGTRGTRRRGLGAAPLKSDRARQDHAAPPKRSHCPAASMSARSCSSSVTRGPGRVSSHCSGCATACAILASAIGW